MSDVTPEPTLALEPEPEQRRGRRTGILAAVVVVVVAVLGGAAYAAYSLLAGGGPQPEDALPASTVAVVSIDLDPSAGQKIQALKSIRKFPALKKSLGINADDDLRKLAFDKIAEASDCKDVNYKRDIEPWLGKRAAMAAVDLGGKDPAPAIVLAVDDAAKARKGFQSFVDCTKPGDDFQFVVGDDFLVASDSKAHAQKVLDEGQKKALADDKGYQKWIDAAGDEGVVHFYVAPRAREYLKGLTDDLTGELAGDVAEDLPDGEDPGTALGKALDSFTGLGGQVRFSGGGMELSVAMGGAQVEKGLGGASVGTQIGDLPTDTAVALGIGVPDDYAKTVLDQLANFFGGSSPDKFVSDAETQTGLDLPEDLQTLLGKAVTLSLGGDAPADLEKLDDPSSLDAGVVLHGDGAEIKKVIAKAEERMGVKLADLGLTLEDSDGKVALSPSETYAATLTKAGKLGSDAGFKAAVPDAAKASSVLYVDFDSAWRETLVKLAAEDSAEDAQAFDDNTKPLRGIGLSAWSEGSTGRLLLKVTTD